MLSPGAFALVLLATVCACAAEKPPTGVPPPGAARVAKVEVTPADPYVMVGDSTPLKATARNAAGDVLTDRSVSWASSDSTIAKISASGVVRGVARGSVTVTAVVEGVSATVALTVGNLLVTISQPTHDSRISDTVDVQATVASVFQIASVTATIGATSAAMAFSLPLSRWIVQLPITGENFGTTALRVRATDVFGNAHEAVFDAIYDPPPAVTIVAPELGAIADPSLRLIASCSDRNAAACKSIAVRISSDPSLGSTPYDVTIASGTTTLNTTVSLAAYEGKSLFVKVAGEDSAGQFAFAVRQILVFTAAGLPRVASVPGTALDFDGARTLYTVPGADGRDVLHIRAGDGSDLSVYDVAGRQVTPDKAYLTPSGAIFESAVPHRFAYILQESRNGSVDSLSGYVSTLAVKDTFAVWSFGPLYLRNLVTGQTTVVDQDDASNTAYDVSSVGDVAYWSTSYQIVYVPYGSAPMTLTTGPLWNVYPLTDGQNVAYIKTTPCCGGTAQLYMMPITGGEIALTPPSSNAPVQHQTFEVRNGWVAYTQPSATGESQVWSRSPAGTSTQVSFFGTSSRIEGLDDAGTIIFANGTTRYRSAAPYTTVTALGSDVGRVIFRHGEFLILANGSVFEIP